MYFCFNTKEKKLNMIRYIPFSLVFICSFFLSFAQEQHQITHERREMFFSEIFPEAYDQTLMRDALLFYINAECHKLGVRQFRTNRILEFTADDLAEFIARRDISRINDVPKRRSIFTRLFEYEAGNKDADEIVHRAIIARGQTLLTYDEVAQDVAFTLFNRPRQREILLNPRYTFIGIGTHLDNDKRRVYINLTFGNHSIASTPRKEFRRSSLPVSVNQQGLRDFDERLCRATDNFDDIYSLYDMIRVEKGTIYFETNNIRALRRLLRNDKDGFAIDIVFWEQYPCNSANVLHNQIVNKGHLLPPVYFDDFVKKNEIKGRQGQQQLKLPLGTIPEGFKDYELNLLIIKNRHVCYTIVKPYKMPFTETGLPEIYAYPDTISRFNTYRFTPNADTATIRFKIPFEMGRSQYKKEDIQAFIDSLNQPNFTPLAFKVIAYSSIDGDPQRNMQLRGERINSMLQAIRAYSDNKVPVTTESRDSWDLFYRDIVGTEFQFLRPQTQQQITDYLRKGDNRQLLEPILQKHRFAEVQITARYDISSVENEQRYVLYLFNNALREFRDDDALAIQKYIMEQVLSKRYSLAAIDHMNIPPRAAYAGIKMNKLWLNYTARELAIDARYVLELQRLQRMAPNNLYIRRNIVFARLQVEVIENENYVFEMQREIDQLLISALPKHVVDPLNLHLQIKSLEALGGTLRVSNQSQFIENAFNRIKNIIEIRPYDWEGALNLAYLFTSMGVYDYPMEIMSSMIHNPNISEDFIFMFISLCTHTDYMHYTEVFEQALLRASEINKQRLCELINTGKISFQIMENTTVKSFYCNMCQ